MPGTTSITDVAEAFFDACETGKGCGVEPLFILRCDRSPVMLTWFRQLTESTVKANGYNSQIGSW
jgi:hypothetical protein